MFGNAAVSALIGIPDASQALRPKPALGFLTVVEHPQHGLFGGYLLLNHGGRPLEFHCTAPIKPNRAQEILYGPTLDRSCTASRSGLPWWSRQRSSR